MALQEILTRYGFEFDGNKIKAIEKGTRRTEQVLTRSAKAAEKFNAGMSRALNVAKGIVGAYLGLRGFQLVTGDVAREVHETQKWADFLGEGVQNMQALSAAARQNSLEQEDLADAMKELAVKANDAFGIAKSKDAQELFKQMGIGKEQLLDNNGELKKTSELMKVVADGYSKMTNRAKAAAALDDLLSDNARRVSKFFSLGRKGIDAAMESARANGLVYSKKTLKAAKDYLKLKKDIITALIGFRNMIASKILPVMVRISRAFREWWNEGNNAERVFLALRLAAGFLAAMLLRLVGIKMVGWFKQLVLGAKAATVWMRSLSRATALAAAKFALISAAIVGIALVVEDLIGFAQGRESLIGELLGEGENAEFLRQILNDLGNAARELLAALAPIFRELWEAAKPALKEIWELIKPMVPFFGKALKFALVTVLIAIIGIIKGLTLLVKAAKFAAKATAEFFIAAWAWIKDAWERLIDALFAGGQAIGNFFASIGRGIVDVWDAVVDAILNFWADLVKFAGKVGRAIAWPFKLAAKGIGRVWDGIITTISKAVRFIIGAIKEAVRLKDELLGGEKLKAIKVDTPEQKRLQALFAARQAGQGPTTQPGGPVTAPVAAGGTQTNVATVQPGAVVLNVTGVPEGAVGATVVDQINRQLTKVITQAGRDIKRPPAGQGG